MDISQPRWKTPEYSKREINEAGAAIRNSEISPEDRAAALRIVDNWRSAHAYPLHVFYMNLRRKCGSRKDILVAERLKRIDSIVGKLQREEGMQLYRMQDLGGCRMVLPTLQDVYTYSESFNRFLIISLDVLICRYSPLFRAFPALFISEEPHKSFYYPLCCRSQK